MENLTYLKEVNTKNNSLVGRRKELQMLKETLFKKRIQSSILVGNAGCGKTAIIEQFSHDMRGIYKLMQFDISGAVAGTRYRGDFEQRINDFLNYVIDYNTKHSKKMIIFIDEIHTLYKAGGAEGAIDAANIFKPYLSQGLITIIGATTPEEYKGTIKNDKALDRRLSPIFIKDLDDKTNLKILKNFSDNLVDDELIEYIYTKSKTLNKTNPDVSIEILDKCMARHKFTGEIITEKTVREMISYMKEEL